MKNMFLKSAVLAAATVGLLAGSAIADFVNFGDDPSDNVTYQGFVWKNGALYSSGDIYTFQDGPLALDVGTYELTFHLDGFSIGTWDDSGDLEDTFTIQAELDNTVIATQSWDDFKGDAVDFNLWVNIPTIESLPSYLTITAWADVTGTDEDWSFENANLVGCFTPAPVPEPATMLLFGTGLAGLAGVARRKKKVIY